MKIYTFFTDSHKSLLDIFLKNFPYNENTELNIKWFPQECKDGSYMSDGWVSTMRRKVEYILQSLNETPEGEWFVHSDCDIVLFDGRYDAGSYAISSSYDDFSNVLSITSADFISTGESREYYMENVPYPPSFPGNIYGASIDIALLGIPDGAAVTDFRIWSLNGEACDFIGMGSLSPAAHCPEPATMLLFGTGLAGFGVFRKKFKKA